MWASLGWRTLTPAHSSMDGVAEWAAWTVTFFMSVAVGVLVCGVGVCLAACHGTAHFAAVHGIRAAHATHHGRRVVVIIIRVRLRLAWSASTATSLTTAGAERVWAPKNATLESWHGKCGLRVYGCW